MISCLEYDEAQGMAFNIGFQPEKKSYLFSENGFEEMNDKTLMTVISQVTSHQLCFRVEPQI